MKFPSFIVAAFALLSAGVEAGSKCTGNLNNLQRCFVASSGLASAYCGSYLFVPIVTVTSTPSAYAFSETQSSPWLSLTVARTITLPNIVATQTDTLLSTEISIFYSTGTERDIETVFSATTTTLDPPTQAKKRQVATSDMSCITKKRGDPPILYEASSISLACSCLSVAPQTLTVIAALATETIYIPETTTTPITSVVEVITTLVGISLLWPEPKVWHRYQRWSQITRTTQTTTETYISISTIINTPPQPPPPSFPSCPGDSFKTPASTTRIWGRIFAGRGVRERLNNPSNKLSRIDKTSCRNND